MPPVYVFSSQSVTNIWAAIGARAWAISRAQAENVGGVARKARALPIGAMGVFYCSELESITTPFLVYSKPLEGIPIHGIWQGEWAFLFRIHPLGTPSRRVHKTDLEKFMPSLRSSRMGWHKLFRFQPTTLFVPSNIDDADWESLLARLVSDIVATWPDSPSPGTNTA